MVSLKNRKILLIIIRGASVFCIIGILYFFSTETKNYFTIKEGLIPDNRQDRKEKKAIRFKPERKNTIPIKTDLTFYDTLTSTSKTEELNNKKLDTPKKKQKLETGREIDKTLEYTIQLGFFTIKEKAEDMVKYLLFKGYPAYLGSAPELKVKGFRVHVGSFKSRKEAEALVMKIKSQDKIQGFVIKTNN
ncbi:MAG: SPOR domain-containing protein [Thermodesulfobacteriota bacterium]|nr:SPOR domain-containing protein [Thermodesulfobacteriota bacterium]